MSQSVTTGDKEESSLNASIQQGGTPAQRSAVKFQQARKAAWLLFRNRQETTPTKL